ncbi:MAG TPA: alpha/beta family hydrolase [Rhabdochlamydiaceae bacterium]|nr:alpha/beta family hydrolase [Rhabdochlamydiaceae bacterium]
MMQQNSDVVTVALGKNVLRGNLHVPKGAQAIVVFAHGSGSGRKSPRNRFVARALEQGNLATLLIDLLTMEEESVDLITRELRFNISLLAKRLEGITEWVRKKPEIKTLKIGYFGASTGAAAALMAAAQKEKEIFAIVSRGGRPDLAGVENLPKVTAPTLLIVGSRDTETIQLNEEALKQLSCEKKLTIIPNATHLFEEPGALEDVAKLARKWFETHLT